MLYSPIDSSNTDIVIIDAKSKPFPHLFSQYHYTLLNNLFKYDILGLSVYGGLHLE